MWWRNLIAVLVQIAAAIAVEAIVNGIRKKLKLENIEVKQL